MKLFNLLYSHQIGWTAPFIMFHTTNIMNARINNRVLKRELLKKLQLLPMKVQNEKGFCQATLNYLKKIGHNVTTFSGIGSAITAVTRENGLVTANSDYRRQGRTAGL